MKRFDSKALHQALDEQRLRLNMTWTEVSTEIGVSVSTIRRTKEGGRMEVDGMIAMVDWLGAQVETFVRENGKIAPNESLNCSTYSALRLPSLASMAGALRGSLPALARRQTTGQLIIATAVL